MEFSRRKFFAGLGAVAAVGMMRAGSDAHANPEMSDRDFEAFIHNPENGKSPEKVAAMVKFVGERLKVRGEYYRTLTESDSEEKMSQALSVVAKVSTYLTQLYKTNSRAPELARYFAIDAVKRSAVTMDIHDASSIRGLQGNGFLATVYGRVGAWTVGHGFDPARKPTRVDVTVGRFSLSLRLPEVNEGESVGLGMTESQCMALGVRSSDLPPIDPTLKEEDIFGSVVVNHSRPRAGAEKEKTAFSFAIPYASVMKEIMRDGRPVPSMHHTNSLSMLKDPRDGALIPGSTEMVVASGESGSPVAVLTENGYVVLGPSSTMQVYDNCRKLCYGIASIPPLAQLQELARRIFHQA